MERCLEVVPAARAWEKPELEVMVERGERISSRRILLFIYVNVPSGAMLLYV